MELPQLTTKRHSFLSLGLSTNATLRLEQSVARSDLSFLNSHWFLAGHMDDHMISELWRAKKYSLRDEEELDGRGLGAGWRIDVAYYVLEGFQTMLKLYSFLKIVPNFSEKKSDEKEWKIDKIYAIMQTCRGTFFSPDGVVVFALSLLQAPMSV